VAKVSKDVTYLLMYAHTRVPVVHAVTVTGSVPVTDQLSQLTWAFLSLCLKYRLSTELLAQKIQVSSRFGTGSHNRPQLEKGTFVKSEHESDLQRYSAHTFTFTFRQFCD